MRAIACSAPISGLSRDDFDYYVGALGKALVATMCCKVLKRAKRYKNTQDEIDEQYVEMLEPTLTSTSKVQVAKHLGRAELDLAMAME